MKKLNEISNMRELDLKRRQLRHEAKKQQLKVEFDVAQIQSGFSKLFSVGKTVSSLTQIVAPKLDWILFGASILKSIFRRKRRK